MTIRRLLDDSSDDFERALLRAAKLDVPSDADVARGVLSVGVAAGAIAGAASAAAKVSSVGASVGHVGQAASAHTVLGAGAAVKWIGMGLVTAALAGTGVASVVMPSTENHAAPTEHGVSRRVPLAQGAPPASLAPPTPVPIAPEERATPPLPERSPSNVVTQRAEPAIAASKARPANVLGAELAVLSRARLAQAARTPSSVITELDAYERLPRPHVLAAEAAMLRMEALMQLGQAARAANLAREYLRAHPSSPHRARLEDIANKP